MFLMELLIYLAPLFFYLFSFLLSFFFSVGLLLDPIEAEIRVFVSKEVNFAATNKLVSNDWMQKKEEEERKREEEKEKEM